MGRPSGRAPGHSAVLFAAEAGLLGAVGAHAAAGPGLLPCCASAGLTRRGSAAGRGSSSKKCGPVSSAGAGAGAERRPPAGHRTAA
ncbi:hypothetical protein O1M63_25160 [Streptomyces mirabilis]|nr:hypothetical protein [Streptomyces mirabilis]